jgi:hypothetical protein
VHCVVSNRALNLSTEIHTSLEFGFSAHGEFLWDDACWRVYTFNT